MTYLAITLYYFSYKEKKQLIDILSDMLSFICYFLFNQSQNNAALEPRTGHFRGLVRFEAKAKDLSKAKDLKMFPQGRPRSQNVLEDSTSVT